ncbi:MAG: glycogen/starch/alpha-glucan phosphorylase [Eubacteriales bacterium]|nr:glycogen/starch/alpha-glucan phosphorylase [Eubacteriales bacterium]
MDALVYGGDPYLLLKDFRSYMQTHERLYAALEDPRRRGKMMLANIADSGIFAADRAVKEYAGQIWHI